MSRFGQIVRELRRRHVFRTSGFYIVGAWVLVQVIALVFQSFDIPNAALQYVWLAAVAVLPLAIIFGWIWRPGRSAKMDASCQGSENPVVSVAGNVVSVNKEPAR